MTTTAADSAAAPPMLRLRDLSRQFGSVLAVNHIDLDVRTGEVLTLLGPSGCGKSTTLRMIAGLEKPNSGDIWLEDRLISSSSRRINIAAEKRGFGMVFQSYAVWPHMTVFDNVAFPLVLRRLKKEEVRERVLSTLDLLGLGGLAERYATMLSGGQQQRVALARAIVYNPRVLLLDEPLSNLDAALREQMRVELRTLQQRLGITSIFVTHDQAEAMVLSDRIVVMNQGVIEEIGQPHEIYERPHSRFTMDFVGRINYLPGRVTVASPDDLLVQVEALGAAPVRCAPVADVLAGDEVLLCVRPEEVGLTAAGGLGEAGWRGVIQVAAYLGDRVEYVVRVGDLELRTSAPPTPRLSEGAVVAVTLPAGAVRVWPTRRAVQPPVAVAVG